MVPPTVRVVPRVMFWFTATVVKLALPVTATVTAWVMVPVVAVAVRLPPTVDVVKVMALLLISEVFACRFSRLCLPRWCPWLPRPGAMVSRLITLPRWRW